MDELAALLAYYQDAFTTLPPEELAAFVQTMPAETRAIGAAYAQGLLEGMAPPEGDSEGGAERMAGGAERVVGQAFGQKYVSHTSDAVAELFGGRWVEGPGGLVNSDSLALSGLAEDVTRGSDLDALPDFTRLSTSGRGGNSRMWWPAGAPSGGSAKQLVRKPPPLGLRGRAPTIFEDQGAPTIFDQGRQIQSMAPQSIYPMEEFAYAEGYRPQYLYDPGTPQWYHEPSLPPVPTPPFSGTYTIPAQGW